MGSCQTKEKSKPTQREMESLKEKVRLLQEEMKEIMLMRESENQVYEQEMMIFSLKDGDWKREKEKLREEVGRLRKRLEERGEGIREVVLGDGVVVGREKEWRLLGSHQVVLEEEKEEIAWRDEAVDKWKKLYLAIKIELDNLIQRTCQGEGLWWIAEGEDLMEKLQSELKAKHETVELLEERLASMEKEGVRKERELDILRQSLRIMTHRKKGKGLQENLPLQIPKLKKDSLVQEHSRHCRV